MSRQNFGPPGNGIIDRYPLLGELKLKKILRIDKESYKELKNEIRRFTIKRAKIKKATCKKHVLKTEKYKAIRDEGTRKPNDFYMSANIENTRGSSFWQWRRVKEWFEQWTDAESLSSIRKHISKNELFY